MRSSISSTQIFLAMWGVASTVLFASSGVAQQKVPHVEACTQNSWGFLVFHDKEFGTVNSCQHDVSVFFLRKDGTVMEATLKPRGVFKSGLKQRKFNGRDWIAATCPAGYAPSPNVSMTEWNRIVDGKYDCVRK